MTLRTWLIGLGWFALVVGDSDASKAPNRQEQDCGVLLSQLTAACGSAKHSRETWCCRALVAWNDAKCWCEKNALRAAQNVAMDQYAFQLRMGRCNVSSFYHGDIALPNSARAVLRSTCGDAHAAARGGGDEEEGCANMRAPLLRQLRVDSLYRLQQSDVQHLENMAQWSAQMDALLAADAWLLSIGLSFSYPRTNVKRYLAQRSSLLKGALWRASIDGDTMAWKGARLVSFAAVTDVGDFSLWRFVFVRFERCSSRMRSVVVQEQEAVAHFAQFVYVEPAAPQLWAELGGAARWCRQVAAACGGRRFPYGSAADCERFARELQARRRLTCARHGELSSVVALHGDTLSCRGMYLRLARARARFCRALGRRALGRCRAAGCPAARYNDFFAEKNPRYESPAGFVCARARCAERWPLA